MTSPNDPAGFSVVDLNSSAFLKLPAAEQLSKARAKIATQRLLEQKCEAMSLVFDTTWTAWFALLNGSEFGSLWNQLERQREASFEATQTALNAYLYTARECAANWEYDLDLFEAIHNLSKEDGGQVIDPIGCGGDKNDGKGLICKQGKWMVTENPITGVMKWEATERKENRSPVIADNESDRTPQWSELEARFLLSPNHSPLAETNPLGNPVSEWPALWREHNAVNVVLCAVHSARKARQQEQRVEEEGR
ncbi:uncharacterized protein KY384_002906 [Bacidia gigantensis]|uniref:uncharacterized protein n=1 Tax=Bacidia gigantensis TaxID=2732470 RepID=UPI001D05AA8C|nr:uncharacterized protein KY384_002906 [Bacidia gigantensis]KAG8532421.1 hypothetical protein KY384_002906 [Bacidia gigantensis]